MKKVTRKYYVKKLKKVITKVYSYDSAIYKKSSKPKFGRTRLTSKSGKQYKAFEKFKATLKTDADRNRLVAVARQYAKQNKILTTGRAEYEIGQQKILSTIDNFGLTVEQVAYDLGTTPEQLLNDANWNENKTQFTNPDTGERITFKYDYNGGVLYEKIV